MKKLLTLALISLTTASMGASFTTNTGGTSSVTNTGYTMGRAGAPVSITQSTDTSTITSGNSVACPADNDGYFRRFDLDGDHGIVENLNVTSVDFGIEAADAITLDVNLYSIANADPLLLANLTQIGTATLAVGPADDLSVVNVAVTGMLDGTTDDLVVEVFAPDFTNSVSFFIGSNANGETADSYLHSAGCGATEPTAVAGLGFPDMNIVMVVNGELDEVMAGPAAMVPTLSWYSLFALGIVLLVFGRKFIKTT